MAHQYYIITDRRTLRLYLAWEVGIARANELLRQAKKVTAWGYEVPLTYNITRLKREAEAVCQRIAQAAAFQEGRLKRQHFHTPLFTIVRS